MNWTELNKEEQIDQITEESKIQPVLIFKHSTRCAISSTTLNRLERNWRPEELAPVKIYFLDLLSYRSVSQKISEYFNVEHESPQLLIVREGKPIYVRSHMAIGFEEIQKLIPSKN